ncbi:MAG: DUF2480 family protein [Saprospiraceae bacterium]|nr:DUF2480 family protein [Saprospiraceae bacterium]
MESLDKPLVNRVAQSGLITIDLETFVMPVDYAHFDLKDYLYQGLVLREKEFRERLKEVDWSTFAGKSLLVYCSTDAIVPSWAYMLVAAQASPHAREVFFGSEAEHREAQILRSIDRLDVSAYDDARVVVKGCAKERVPERAYVELLTRLQPVVRSLMFGEPCSTVPVYKRR